MRSKSMKMRSGLTFVELIVAIGIAAILLSAVGALVASGNRAWQQAYSSAHKKIKQDAQAAMITFGSMGRKSNRLGYTIYDVSGQTFTPAVPQTSDPEEVVSGDAVEFRYWDVELDSGDSHQLLDVSKIATAYALFYLDGSRLKVDYGPYPPGGVPDGGGSRNSSHVSTTVLAENVTTDDGTGAFSHTTLNGVGQGCVRINITLTDGADPNDSVKVMTATLMRNIWPR